jgi:hypothetical protein
MSRQSMRPTPSRWETLETATRRCPACGGRLSCHYTNRRAVVTLDGPLGLRLKVRRCVNRSCARYHRAFRPEGEGALVLPQQEFGLDIIALVGRLRYTTRASVPEIHADLVRRGVVISERSVTNLLDRYDELVATAMTDPGRLRARLAEQGRAVLAIDGLQPQAGHEVLWVIRECISSTVVLARALLSGTAVDLAPLLAPGGRSRRRAGDRRGQRWSALDPHRRRQGAARGATPAVPLPLSARGGASDLRGRPACQEGAEETGPRNPTDRAGGRGPPGRRSRSGAWLLRRGAQRSDR